MAGDGACRRCRDRPPTAPHTSAPVPGHGVPIHPVRSDDGRSPALVAVRERGRQHPARRRDLRPQPQMPEIRAVAVPASSKRQQLQEPTLGQASRSAQRRPAGSGGVAAQASDAARRACVRGRDLRRPPPSRAGTACSTSCSPPRYHRSTAGIRIDSATPSTILKGASPESVSKLLGHTSIKVTELHYTWLVLSRGAKPWSGG